MGLKFVLDFEALIGKFGEYVVKELSVMPIAGTETDIVTHVFKPPYSWYELNTKQQRANRWLTFHRHQLKWTDGSVNYEQLSDVLKSIRGVIYVKGPEKASFVATHAERAVFELGTLGCPKVDTLLQALPLSTCSVRMLDTAHKCQALAHWCNDNLSCVPSEKIPESLVSQHPI